MIDKINEIKYKDIGILLTDLSHLDPQSAINILEESLTVVPTYGKKAVYSLIDVTEIKFNPALMNIFRKVGRENLPYVIGTAVCGLTPMTKLLAKGVIRVSGRKASFFDKLDEGKEWLYQLSRELK